MHYLILLPGIYKSIVAPYSPFNCVVMTQHALRQIKITTAPCSQWGATGWPNPPLLIGPRYLN